MGQINRWGMIDGRLKRVHFKLYPIIFIITDNAGKILLRKTFGLNTGYSKPEIDIASLIKGKYYLIINTINNPLLQKPVCFFKQ